MSSLLVKAICEIFYRIKIKLFPEKDYYTPTYDYVRSLDSKKITFYFRNNLYLREYLGEYDPNSSELCARIAGQAARAYHRTFTDFTETH